MAITGEQRAFFERLGLEVVRRDLGLGFSIPDASQLAAVEWCAEQDRSASKHRRSVERWTIVLAGIAALTGIIAMIAGVIAAIPVVASWMR